MACGCGTYTPPTINNCNITATVCKNHYIDIIPAHTVVILGAAASGTATLLDNGNIRYIPDVDFSGDDGLVYTWASGSCTITFEVIEGIPENTKVIILTASAECEVGTATYEWELPPCATLAPGYTIYDNPIHVIVPLFDPENTGETCDISVNICCDFCNNCCKCEHFLWNPPICVYPCSEDPICECNGPCETYNPITGNCDPCLEICCELGEGSYTCQECCDVDDCPTNQECISGNCACPPGTIINQYGACCPTTLPSCAICDAAGNVVENVNLDCEDNEEIDYDTCTCICTEGLCRDIITGLCVECPPCVPTAGRLQYSGVSGYEAYTETCPACQNCVACVECPGGFECVDTPCATTGPCNGVSVPLVPNLLPFVDYIDPCTGLMVTCSEQSPCCCKKNPPVIVPVFICNESDGQCYPYNGVCAEDDDNCYEDLGACNDACGGVEANIGACCIAGVCSHLTAAQCEAANGVYYADDSECSDIEPCVTVYPTGACCKDGVCFTTTEDICDQLFGMYIGDNEDCTPSSCLTPGCTSFPEIDITYVCGDTAAVVITGANGRYYRRQKRNNTSEPFVDILPDILIATNNYAFNINFTNAPYSLPVGGQVRLVIVSTDDCPSVEETVTYILCPLDGACCKDNVCYTTTEALCINAGGTYEGDGVSCDGVTCGDPGGCTSFPTLDVDYDCGNQINWVVLDGEGRTLKIEKRNSSVLAYSLVSSFVIPTNDHSGASYFTGMPVGGQFKYTILADGDCPEITETVTYIECPYPNCESFPEMDTNYVCGNNVTVSIIGGLDRTLQITYQAIVGGPFLNGNQYVIINNSYNQGYTFSSNSVPVGGQLRFTILATADCPEVVLIVTRLECEPPEQILVWCCHDNICEQITVAQCQAYEGIVYNSSHTCGINCLPDVTPLPMGCCYNGNCTEVYSAEECPGILYGTPAECQETCESVGPPPPTGACCISGNCYGGMTEDDCTESGGIYYGDETLCLAEDCESPCEDITTTGVITQDEIIIPQNYIYIPAWSNGNSI